ncbi:acyltransferase family protein [Geodermatophilus sp. SYSU D00703]
MHTHGDTRSAPQRDIRALTGLRAVAACWVMLLHLQVFAGPYLDQLPLLRPFIGAGWTGVELFFVLSGFVLTRGYLDRVGSRPTAPAVGRFLLHRFARVWPAWAVVTVLAGAWVWTFRATGLDPDVLGSHPDADLPTLLRQLTMTQMWGEESLGGTSFVQPGWSISAEWTAYLVFPLAVVLVRPLRRLPAAVLLLASVGAMAPLAVNAFVHATPDSEQNWVLRIVCGFTSGMLAALAHRQLRGGRRLESAALTTVWASVFLVLAGASWAAWAAWRQGPDGTHDFNGVVVVVFPLLVVGLSLTDRGPARWLSSRPMTYGGELSYALYLVHFPVLEVVVAAWWQDPADRNVVTPGLALAVPGIVIACLLASAALHHGVEKPARVALLRLVSRRPSGAPVPVLPPRHAQSSVVAAPPAGRTGAIPRTRCAAPPADGADGMAGSGVHRRPAPAPAAAAALVREPNR